MHLRTHTPHSETNYPKGTAMSAATIAFIVGTHFLALVIGMIAHSLVLEREDRITETEVVTDPDLMALADIFIPKK